MHLRKPCTLPRCPPSSQSSARTRRHRSIKQISPYSRILPILLERPRCIVLCRSCALALQRPAARTCSRSTAGISRTSGRAVTSGGLKGTRVTNQPFPLRGFRASPARWPEPSPTANSAADKPAHARVAAQRHAPQHQAQPTQLIRAQASLPSLETTCYCQGALRLRRVRARTQ